MTFRSKRTKLKGNYVREFNIEARNKVRKISEIERHRIISKDKTVV